MSTARDGVVCGEAVRDGQSLELSTAVHHRAIAKRLPLLPRTRLRCETLAVRVSEIEQIAHTASRETGAARKMYAAETLNRAALVASDCGAQSLAESWCWRQFEIYSSARPLGTRDAIGCLHPLINIGRLMIRQGRRIDGQSCFETLHRAILHKADYVNLAGRQVDLRGLIDTQGDLEKICAAVWRVLSSEGVRAFVRAGAWDQAVESAKACESIGERLLGGRQILIAATSSMGQAGAALEVLDETDVREEWEDVVAACLRVLCYRSANVAVGTWVDDMLRKFRKYQHSDGPALFKVQLGLSCLDMATESGADLQELVDEIAKQAVNSGDGYPAMDVLAHDVCRQSMSACDKGVLETVVRDSWLGRGYVPMHPQRRLLEAVDVAAAALASGLERDE